MAPWSSRISDGFQSIPANPRDSDFYAPYNKLLCTLFPVDTAFTVDPQPRMLSSSHGGFITFKLEYIVFYVNIPVLLLHVHAPASISTLSVREGADAQMRTKIRDLRALGPLGTMYGVCAFGTKLCLYRGRVGGKITPQAPLGGSSSGAGVEENEEGSVPRSWWDCDLLEDDGAIELKEAVNEIRNLCENLQ